MGRRLAWSMIGGAALLASLSAVVPAIGAATVVQRRADTMVAPPAVGLFTPAAADPRLAATLARVGALGGNVRFTPSASTRSLSRQVTVAVRSGNVRRDAGAERTAPSSIGITPVAYNLGMSVGWKRFALSGDVRAVDTGPVPGSRTQANVGVSYTAPRWTARLQAERDEPRGVESRLIQGEDSYSVDLGGSYRLSRNLDVTAGVRYRSERDRLEMRSEAQRDSQAVYVGTAFRF